MTDDECAFADAGRYLYGPTEHRQPKKARSVMERLEGSGFIPARHALAMMYYDGKGVRRDYTKAFLLLSAAAEEGYATSELMVGTYHRSGFKGVVPVDLASAVFWFRRAAAQGNASAQYNLGNMLRNGWGCEADPAEAYLWQRLGAHCARPLPTQMYEFAATQLALELGPEKTGELDNRVAALRRELPLPQADHLFYWKSLLGAE